MSVYDWSTTAGTNATADANINWAEGQLPSSVNDSARAMMAALAAMIRDQGGYATTGGTSSAYTLALSQTMASRVPGLVGFTAHATSAGGGVTLNVDGTGAAPLRAKTGVALAAGHIVSGGKYVATWNSGTSEWLLINYNGASLETNSALGTPASGTLTNCTGLPISTGVSGLATGVATFLATPSSSNLASAVTDETGSGALVFATSPALVTPDLGTPSAGTLTNCTGLPTTGLVDASVTPAKLSQPLTRGTAQASTSGTSIDFTSIPSWARRITVAFNGVSTNGTAHLLVQIGVGTTATTSGYVSNSAFAQKDTSATGGVSSTAGFVIYNNNITYINSGIVTLVNVSGNVWVMSGTTANAIIGVTSAGSITLGGTLGMVRITTSNGSDAFDAGSLNILYEG